MSDRVRGAAYVNVMWVIFLFVLLLGAGGTIWTFANERAKFISDKEDAEAITARVSEQNTNLTTQLAAISVEVGYKNPDDPGSYSQPAEIKTTIDNTKNNHPFIGESVATLDALVAAFESEVSSLQDRLSSEVSARQRAEAARAEADNGKTQQQSDAQEALAKLNDDLETQREELNDSLTKADAKSRDLDDRLQDAEARERSVQDQMDEKVDELNSEIKSRDNNLAELRKKLEVLRNPEEPDGEVIAASPSLGICYIDLGRKDMLRRGTRFDVFRVGKGGARQPTGVVEVRKLHDDRAECGIVEAYDAYDPIAPGDLIMAPLYDREMVREFVLVGRFPAGYSKDIVTQRLESLGASVSKTVSTTTDFLVVGDREFVSDLDSEETGEVADTEEFRLASQYKVQMLPVRELLDLLKYD